MNTILVIIILIGVVFLLSGDERLNEVIKNQSVPVLILLLVFYFFFNKIDFRILCVIFIIVLLYFSKFGSKVRDHINSFIFNSVEVKQEIIQNNINTEISPPLETETNNDKKELLKHLIDMDDDEDEESEDYEFGTKISDTQKIKEIDDEMGDLFNKLND